MSGRWSLTQNARLLKLFLDGGTTTALEAAINLGILNLSQRIHELREEGHDIACEDFTSEDGTVCGRYRYVSPPRQEALPL